MKDLDTIQKLVGNVSEEDLISENNKVELCFNCDGVQIRISGELELNEDNQLKDEIAAHPSRTFLKPWLDSITTEEFHDNFAGYRLKSGIATLWMMEKNLEPREIVQL